MSETYNISYSRLELPRRIFYLSVSKKRGVFYMLQINLDQIGSVLSASYSKELTQLNLTDKSEKVDSEYCFLLQSML